MIFYLYFLLKTKTILCLILFLSMNSVLLTQTLPLIANDQLCNLPSDKISVLSLNIQSLPAKFLDFSELVDEFTVSPDVICLQETWKVIDNTFFPLNNYHTLETNTRSTARGGGLESTLNKTYHLKF